MSLLIGTPCYGMKSWEPYDASMHRLRKELISSSFPHDVLTLGKESLITRARNVIASSFLYETKYECLLFIDSDIQFDPADVALLWNLCYEGADIAVGAYRNKKLDAKLQAWVGGQLREVAEFSEPFEVDYAGTGFMMIKRRVFEKMQQIYRDWEYVEGFPLDERQAEADIELNTCWAFFQDPIEETPQGRYHLSEDYFFVSRARELGFKVIMHPEIKLTHWGPHGF